MRAEEWNVERFRSIEEGELELEDFTIIIGKNNSGKSNIIDSLKTIREFNSGTKSPMFTEDWVIENTTGKDPHEGFGIGVRVQIPENIRDSIFSGIDKARESTRRNPAAVPEPEEMYDDGWLSKLEYQLSYSPDPAAERTVKINYGGEYEDVNDINGSQKVYGASILNHVMDEDIFGSWLFVDPFREPTNQQETSFTSELEPHGENLIRVLDTLDSNYPDVFESISSAYVDMMEGISDLRVEYQPELGSRTKTIVVEEENFETKFTAKDISSGSKEILVLLTQIYSAEEFGELLIIEEPELHVHPGAVNKIYDILRDIVRDGGPQLIVSTHSDVFVDQTDVSNIVRVERDGDTSIRKVDGSFDRELSDLGYDKSGMLQSEAVVFVEGRSDKRVLKRFAGTADIDLEKHGISIVELDDYSTMKRDAKSLVKLLYSFDIPYLFLADSHGRAVEDVRGELYESMRRDDDEHWWNVQIENIHVWEGYGIESYLLKPGPISECVELENEDIEEIIDEHSDVEDKKSVMNEIYAEDNADLDVSDDIYQEDHHGMEIARKMEWDELDEEVVEVLEKITGMVGVKELN